MEVPSEAIVSSTSSGGKIANRNAFYTLQSEILKHITRTFAKNLVDFHILAG